MTTARMPRPKTWRMSAAVYDRLVESGELEGQRVELIDGKIIQMPPQTEPHGIGVMLAHKALMAAFGPGFTVRPQLPLSLGRDSKPEPDVAVVKGAERDTLHRGAPTSPLLVVEVSLATLAFDRTRKLSLYARFGVPEYWIINLVDRQLEVYRGPAPDRERARRFKYEQTTVLKPDDSIAPLSAAGAPVRVSDLLP